MCSSSDNSNCSVDSSVNITYDGYLYIRSLNANHSYIMVSVQEWKDRPDDVLGYTLSLEPLNDLIQLRPDETIPHQEVRRNQNKCYQIDLATLY